MEINPKVEQLLLHFPGYIFWKDVHSVFLGANHAFARILGYKHGLDMTGLTDYELSCELSSNADDFIAQDKQSLLGNKITTLNIHTYPDGERRILLTEKAELFGQDKKLAGIIGHSIALTTKTIFTMAHLLAQQDSKIIGHHHSSHGSYLISQYSYRDDLSIRESQCLFFLIRGQTTKEIAANLQLSHKTVETYIGRIKNKLRCRTKSQLIEMAIHNGYVTIIPNSLLGNLYS